ncbi:hypothetical protein AB0P12_32530 [Streptomyces subrutilus]
MSGDEQRDQVHTRTSRRGTVAVTLGAVIWIATVAVIVARGWL